MINIVEYSEKCHEAAKAKGWHTEKHDKEKLLMLIISEMAEAVEADRKGKFANRAAFDWKMMDIELSKIGNDSNFINQQYKIAFESQIKDSVEDEIADAAIRIFDYFGLEKSEEYLSQTSFNGKLSHFSFSAFLEDFPYTAFTFCKSVVHSELINALALLFAIAEYKGIDLVWHIEQKLKYNQLRPNKHGKSY